MSVTTLPEHIRRFRILSELGHGAMGRVYLAEDPRIGRKIALKVLSPRQIADGEEDELRERFLQEARAAGRLIHPGIVAVFDADTDPASGDPYLAMEWVDGRTLRDILKEKGRLDAVRAVDLVAQVAAALDYAHRHHVIHRDVKPANLLVTPDGAVKVTDFGIAKLKSQELTLPGHIIGSPYYMAPEQVKAESVDGRADLFSLGVVLYECLTGELAFGGDSLANVTYRIVSVAPQPPEAFDSAIPPGLCAVLTRALEKDPKNRFQTGAELQHELRAVAAELEASSARPRSARPASFPMIPRSEERRAGAELIELEAATVSLSPLHTRLPPHRPRRLRDGLVPALFVLFLLAVMAWSAGILPSEGRWSPDGGPSSSSAQPSEVTRTTPSDLPTGDPTSFSANDLHGPASPPAGELPAPETGDAPPAAELTPELGAETAAVESSPDTGGRELEKDEPKTPETPPPAVPAALLEVVFENRLRAAYISVWVDGDRMMYDRMEARGFWKRAVGQGFRRTIRVSAGRHLIEVHVSGVAKKKIEAYRSVHASFSPDELMRMEVVLKKDSGGYELDLSVSAP